MIKNIIIVDNNIKNIQNIINVSVNTIDTKNIKTFVATNKDEIQEIGKTNDISLILINKNLDYINCFTKNYPVLYYRK